MQNNARRTLLIVWSLTLAGCSHSSTAPSTGTLAFTSLAVSGNQNGFYTTYSVSCQVVATGTVGATLSSQWSYVGLRNGAVTGDGTVDLQTTTRVEAGSVVTCQPMSWNDNRPDRQPAASMRISVSYVDDRNKTSSLFQTVAVQW